MDRHLNDMVEELKNLRGIEKIFLLAEQRFLLSCQNIFSTANNEDIIRNSWFLLIVVNDTVSVKNLESQLEAKVAESNPVIFWIIKESSFSKNSTESKSFASRVIRYARLLSSQGNALEILPYQQDTFEPLIINVDSWLNRACEFLVASQLFLLRKQIKMAAFCLHQSAEQAYSAILCRFMGIRPETHKLPRLHLYAGFFVPKLFRLFPPNAVKEECLLSYLQKAYIEARYSEKFCASAEKISTICEKVSMLIKYASANQVYQTPAESSAGQGPFIIREDELPYGPTSRRLSLKPKANRVDHTHPQSHPLPVVYFSMLTNCAHFRPRSRYCCCF